MIAIKEVENVIEKYNAFNRKPCKKRSKELRLAIGELKKNTPKIRQTLRELDDKGYESNRTEFKNKLRDEGVRI